MKEFKECNKRIITGIEKVDSKVTLKQIISDLSNSMWWVKSDGRVCTNSSMAMDWGE